MQDIVISVDNGSGAVYLFEQIRNAFLQLPDFGFPKPLEKMPNMAIVWKPGITWTNGTNFTENEMQSIIYKDQLYTLKKTMHIDGLVKNESAWGYPTLLHEFGHYILFRYRDNNPFGKHSVFDANDPNLAWSE